MKLQQLLAELYGCNGKLQDERILRRALRDGIARVGAHIVSDAIANYKPHGLTLVYFLAESHVMITTWPEYNLALLDVLLCNADMQPETVLAAVTEVLAPRGGVSVNRIQRKIGDARAEQQ